jgi:hypothetical protein
MILWIAANQAPDSKRSAIVFYQSHFSERMRLCLITGLIPYQNRQGKLIPTSPVM